MSQITVCSCYPSPVEEPDQPLSLEPARFHRVGVTRLGHAPMLLGKPSSLAVVQAKCDFMNPRLNKNETVPDDELVIQMHAFAVADVARRGII